MRAVNLLPRDAHSRPGLSLGARAGAAPLAAAGGVALGTVVAVTAAFVVVHARAASEQKKLASARAQLTQITAQRRPSTPPASATTPIVPVPAVTQELQPRLDALSAAMGSRIAWDRVLREFSLVVPSDITVSGLTLNSGFSLTGTAFSQDSVARLLSRLSLIPDLSGVSLQNSSAAAGTGQVTFTISAALKPAASAGVTGA